MEFLVTSSHACHPGFFSSLRLWRARLCEGKTLSSHQATRSGATLRRSESTPFIFSLFVVTVTVTHPESSRTFLLFLLTPWIMECCHSWLALNHLPLVFYFEGGFIGFLSRLCVENDLELEPTSAVKIKIDMTSMGLTEDKWLFCKDHFAQFWTQVDLQWRKCQRHKQLTYLCTWSPS